MQLGNWKELKIKFEEINNKIFENYDTVNLTSYEKRKIIFNYLCNNIKYDFDYLDKLIKIAKKETTDTFRSPSMEIESVLNKKQGVCNAIAQVYRVLLEMNDIYSLCVICDNGMEVAHQLNLVYDNEHNTFSFDDITSVIVQIDSKENLFDYDKKYASSIGQGNKRIFNEEDGEWMFLSSEYLDVILGRKNDKFSGLFDFDDGINWHLPENIKSIKNYKTI